MMNCTLEEEEEECGRNEDSDEEAEDLRKTKSTKVPYTKRSQRKKHLVDAEESSGNNTSNNMTPTSNDKSNIPTASAKNSGKLSLRQRVARRFASPSSKKISREENISSSSADIVSRKMSATLKAKVASVLGTNRNKGLFNPPTLGTLEDDVNIYSCSMQGLSQDHGCPGGGRGKGKKKGSVNAASIVDIGLVRRRVMAEMAINSAGEEASSSSSASSSGQTTEKMLSLLIIHSLIERGEKYCDSTKNPVPRRTVQLRSGTTANCSCATHQCRQSDRCVYNVLLGPVCVWREKARFLGESQVFLGL